MEKTNEAMREAIQNRLLDNLLTAEATIEVAVLAQNVTISGVVDSPEAKQAAESEARSVSGVGSVINAIEVHQDVDRAEVDPATGARPPIIPKTNQ